MHQRHTILRSLGAALTIVLGTALFGQVAGDYGSWATGAWNTNATWRVYDGASWATSPVAAAPPNANSNVWIRTGTTVTAVYGSTYNCQNLYIQAGARLYNNNTGATNLSYLHVFGTTIQCDGSLGNGATLDGISLAPDGPNVTLSGAGAVDVARIRKEYVNHPISGAAIATTNFTIGMNVNLRFSTGSNTMLYNGCSAASNFHVTINAGATVTLLGAGGTGNVCIDGLTGTDTALLGGSLTVAGNLIIPGILYATTNNANATYACRITIQSGGYVRTGQISSAASGVGGHYLTVNSGGTLEIRSTPNAWNSYFTTNNNFAFNANSTTIYSGPGSQDVRNVNGGYGHLRFTGTGTKTLFGSTLAKGNLTIDNLSGTPVLDVSASNFQMTVQGNWSNYNQSGFQEGIGFVLFNGTAGTQTLTTPGGEQFYNWNIQKTSVQPLVQLNSPVQVASQIQMNGSGAIIDLNGNELRLLNSNTNAITVLSGAALGTAKHIVSELTDNSSRVRWEIGSTTGAHLVPFGTTAAYTPFTFDLTAGNAGSVTMATYGTPPDNLPWPTTPTLVTTLGSYLGLLTPDNRDATVDRFWQVDVTGAPTSQLTFTYAPSELPVAPYNNPNSLLAQRWSSAGQLWEPQITGSAAAYYAVADVVNTYGAFTLSNIISPLPVELLSFTARPEGTSVRLDWTTATERNNDYFTVLRSRDGGRFEEVLRVDGAGNSSTTLGYEAYDRQPYDGLSFYKLRQTDTDGTWKESQAVAVRFNGEHAGPVIYPNPVSDIAYLQGLPEEGVELRVIDAAGRTVAQTRKPAQTDRFEWPLGELPAGAYTLLIGGTGAERGLRLLRQ